MWADAEKRCQWRATPNKQLTESTVKKTSARDILGDLKEDSLNFEYDKGFW
jgi:hypothetical protein